jgi:hypothetical protein
MSTRVPKTVHAMPWAVVAYPKRRWWPFGSRKGEGVPRTGYLCHRYQTEYEARVMCTDLRPYWPGARLEVEFRD